MAFISTLLLTFIVIYIHSGNAQQVFVRVECKNENIGQYGQKSMLECMVKTSEDVRDPQIRFVSWKKEESEEEVLGFFHGKTTNLQGYEFAESSWNNRNMNISLLITDTAVKDEGVYICSVMTNSGGGDQKSKTRLKVTAKYSVPTIIPEGITQDSNTDGALICNSEGGYPGGELRWFDEHNVDWTKSAKMETKKQQNGLFQLSSKLTLLRGSIFSKYTCVVFNGSGGKVDEVTFETSAQIPEELGEENRQDLVSKVGAPLMVIGSLIVGLLLALLIYRRNSRQVRRPSAAPFIDHHQEVHTGESDAEEADHVKIEHVDSMA